MTQQKFKEAPDLVQAVTAQVMQAIEARGPVAQLFEDYPEIKKHEAFAIVADDYAKAFMANGDDIATAIQKAGDALGEEYGLGKYKPQLHDGGRTRGSQDRQEEEDPAATIAGMAKARPGSRGI